MATTGIRGTQIKDETIESVDLASGSIKKGELNVEAVSSQTTITSVDTSNDYLLIFDATDSTLKKVAPTNLGVGGSGSPGGSDTQVQFNDGSSFGGDAGLTFNKTSGLLTVAKGAVFNEGSHDSDFRVESNDDANILFVNAGTNRIGIGTNTPTALLHISSSETGALFRIDHPDSTIDNPIFFVTGSAGQSKVGIGTETPDATFAISDDGKVFEVGSAAEGSWFEINNGAIYLNQGGGYAISGGDFLGQRFNIAPINATYGALGIGKYPGSTVNIFEVNSANSVLRGDFFVIDSDGNTGIGTTSPGATLDVTGDVNFDGGAVFNESSADKDFRVESNGNANMLFVNGGNDRVGIGTDAPLTTLHISGSASTDASITIQGQADAGIRLAADKANGDEGNNPYIDWYQDGLNPASRNNRVAMIAMEGVAGTAFTGSLANSLFIDTFSPSSQASNTRRFQIATDCSSSSDGANHSARLTIEGGHGYVGLHTTTATSPLHVYSNESGNYAALIDNDNGSSGHGLKVTSDGTGTGTNLLDVEAASTTVFRVRGDGRVGIGKVASLPAAVLTVSSSNTDGDIAIAHKIQHIGDDDTFIEFQTDSINIQAGGVDFIKITEDDSQDMIVFNEGSADVDFRVESNNKTHAIFVDAGNDRVAIGHSTPDAILHIDNGTSNTEVIIEKDAGTSGSIVFHNAGSREAEIAFSTNEDIEITNRVADKDITLNIVSGSTEAAALTVDASTATVVAHKQFARGTVAVDLGSGTTSTIDPSVSGAGTFLITASSITSPTSGPTESIHVCSLRDGKVAGQILTLVIVTTFLAGASGAPSMGILLIGPDSPLNSATTLVTFTGEAVGGNPQGSTAVLIWTGSVWAVLSTRRGGGST